MIAFLVTFGLAALFIALGVRASVRLRVPELPTVRHLSGLRRSYSTPMGYTTPKHIRKSEDAVAHYPRKAFVLTILILLILSVIVLHTLSLAIH